MGETTRAVIQATFEASNDGRIQFGGTGLDFGFGRPQQAIAEVFDGDGVRAAILGAQQGRVTYPEFKVLSQRAGCVAYTVWIAGRHVTCTGRRGETHVERFPD